MENTGEKLAIIKIETLIKDPNHPRRESGNLESLITSLRHDGLLTPITIVQVSDDKYHVADGWRRVEAAKAMGLKSISSYVYENMPEAEIANKSYVLNTQRNQLNDIEIANHIKKMRDDFGWSYRDMEIKGYGSNANLSRWVKLLDLPKDIQDKVAGEELSKAHGTALLNLESPKEIRNMAKRAIDHGWSAKNLDGAVKKYLAPKKHETALKTKVPFDKDIPGVYFKDSKDMNELPDESVGCIFTSPPYFVGMEYEQGYSFEEHLENIEAVMKECARLIVPGGVIALNVDDIYGFKGKLGTEKSHILLMIQKYQSFLRKHGVHLEDRIVWVKDQNPHSKDMSKSFSADTVHTTYQHIKRHDFVYIFRKKGERPVPAEDVKLGSALNKEEWKAYIPSVWTIPAEWESKGHPTVFPEELARRVIKMYSFEKEVILDPFLGSGTTIKVARELGREGIGYERAEELYKGTIAEKLKGTEPATDVEPIESVTEFVEKQMEDLEAHQPGEPEPEVIMSEGMEEAVDAILSKPEKEVEHA